MSKNLETMLIKDPSLVWSPISDHSVEVFDAIITKPKPDAPHLTSSNSKVLSPTLTSSPLILIRVDGSHPSLHLKPNTKFSFRRTTRKHKKGEFQKFISRKNHSVSVDIVYC
jgi:hypothetical protein